VIWDILSTKKVIHNSVCTYFIVPSIVDLLLGSIQDIKRKKTSL